MPRAFLGRFSDAFYEVFEQILRRNGGLADHGLIAPLAFVERHVERFLDAGSCSFWNMHKNTSMYIRDVERTGHVAILLVSSIAEEIEGLDPIAV